MSTVLTKSKGISRPPTSWEKGNNVAFYIATHVVAWLTVLLVIFILVEIGWGAAPAMKRFGLSFLATDTWDPNAEKFGVRPQIWGTLYSSVLAVVIGSVFGLSVAIFLSERFLSSFAYKILKLLNLQHHRIWGRLPDSLELFLRNLVQLLAAIPSVVYGLWGIFVVSDVVKPMCDWLHNHLGWIPLFGTSYVPFSMFPAAIVLSIMVLPTISAISNDALVAVPPKLRQAAYGLGATRWEALTSVIIPTARTGIFGAVLLAFGRAVGETMALAMLVGNANFISWSLFSPANTLAALMANTFPEAGRDPNMIAALMYAAVVLLGITLVVNVLGAWVLQRSSRQLKGGR